MKAHPGRKFPKRGRGGGVVNRIRHHPQYTGRKIIVQGNYNQPKQFPESLHVDAGPDSEDPRMTWTTPCFVGSFICLVVVAANVTAEELKPTATGKKTGLIPRKVLFGNPDRAAARISPDGK